MLVLEGKKKTEQKKQEKTPAEESCTPCWSCKAKKNLKKKPGKKNLKKKPEKNQNKTCRGVLRAMLVFDGSAFASIKMRDTCMCVCVCVCLCVFLCVCVCVRRLCHIKMRKTNTQATHIGVGFTVQGLGFRV